MAWRSASSHSRELPPHAAHHANVIAALAALAGRVVAATRRDTRDELHPLRFGAAVVFADGGVASAWQKKALEYSCSLDAVTQLAQAIEARRAAAAPEAEGDGAAAVIAMADQYGMLHGPFATARAYLAEHGFAVRPLDDGGATRRGPKLRSSESAVPAPLGRP